MGRQTEQNVIDYQNRKKQKKNILRIPNVAMFIFALILVYIIVSIFGYFNAKHIVPYEVKEGSLSSNNLYRGIALRNEKIIYAGGAGYINYYAREGERVGVGNLVYTLDESGKLADYLNANAENENKLSDKDLFELKSEIEGFVSNFNHTNFSTIYDFKYDMKGTVLKMANANVLSSIDAINSSGISELISLCTAPDTGIVVYSTDGMEELKFEQFTNELFNEDNYTKEQLINNDLIADGDPVYKLSQAEDWSIVIPIEKEKADELVELQYVKVKFLKNQNTSWGEVSTYTNPDGETFVKLGFTNSMVTFCTDRFIDIELITEEDSGLKIPNSAIVEKEFFIVPKSFVTNGGVNGNPGVMREGYTEDGTLTTDFIETTIYHETETEYYLDDTVLRMGDELTKQEGMERHTIQKKGTLIGVYNINKGYADFKQINILYQNDEYAIVKSNTRYGLTVYDYIVLDASSVVEDEIINE